MKKETKIEQENIDKERVLFYEKFIGRLKHFFIKSEKCLTKRKNEDIPRKNTF